MNIVYWAIAVVLVGAVAFGAITFVLILLAGLVNLFATGDDGGNTHSLTRGWRD
jgi:hypothetical protein